MGSPRGFSLECRTQKVVTAASPGCAFVGVSLKELPRVLTGRGCNLVDPGTGHVCLSSCRQILFRVA